MLEHPLDGSLPGSSPGSPSEVSRPPIDWQSEVRAVEHRRGRPLPEANVEDLRAWARAGMLPAWSREWRDGVDVTDSPELWPRELSAIRTRAGRRARQ
ncbi:hypothetical protein [Naasia lichenicola]|uniref:Uncharacterized protein n=1 Tax=Naasia lichenicola TaxID=2565933 RepID=A0A4V3WSV9_9MICO|nr:hypothetical protein [Naasia lichenicola]THG29627.1 hypothetical protein E6C64_13200 [Naasia lichenicola]